MRSCAFCFIGIAGATFLAFDVPVPPGRLVLGMMILSYVLVVVLIATKYFTPVMLIILLAIPKLKEIFPAFLKPKPEERPEGFPDGQGGWPLYFAPLGFANNRSFGGLFMLGLLIDVAIRVFLPDFWV